MASSTPSKRNDIVVAARDASIKAATPGRESLIRSNRGTPKASTPIEPRSSERRNPDRFPRKEEGTVPDFVVSAPPVAAAATASASATQNDYSDTDEGEDEVESLESHRVDQLNATVDIRVKWIGGDKTWEPEWSLQEQVPTLVYKYWDNLDGREAATGLDTYHVFRILKHTPAPSKAKKSDFMYQVQWTGYRPGESTWETASALQSIAPGELANYQEKQRAAVEASENAQKRKAARGPGRPRKKARADRD